MSQSIIGDLGLGLLWSGRDSVKSGIIQFELLNGAGTKLNPGDRFSFRVIVHNEGWVKLEQAKLKVVGSGYASFSMDDGNNSKFDSPLISQPFAVNAQSVYRSPTIFGRADRGPITIENWPVNNVIDRPIILPPGKFFNRAVLYFANTRSAPPADPS